MDDFVEFNPISFFQLNFDCSYIPPQKEEIFSLNLKNANKYLVPDTSLLLHETQFAKISMAWNEDGLEFLAQVNQPFQQVYYPQVNRGDSLEVFLDTRDVKTSGYNTRFCHHFFCLPEALEGRQAGEITKFRTEDIHEICKPKELKSRSLLKKDSYQLQFFIPSQCLYGYDPEQFNKIGFSYRMNRCAGQSQHFSVTSDEYQIEQQPSLWSSVRLLR